jgi:formate dehydrogenase maturation protein FdhE
VSPFGERDRRATELSEELPHATEILGLYRAVLAEQARLYEWARTFTWRDPVSRPEEETTLRLKQLPMRKLESRFGSFCESLRRSGTDLLAAPGLALSRATSVERAELLQLTVTRESPHVIAKSLGCEIAPLAFYSRAFLQAIVETLAPSEAAIEGAAPLLSCPYCGWPPQVAILRDEPEVKSRRLLQCALCSTSWPFPRLACPGCGEIDSKKLVCHEVETRAHLRVEECQTCLRYLKTIDMRQTGLAVPVVDDIASVELDIWATERGLSKICPNLLGH